VPLTLEFEKVSFAYGASPILDGVDLALGAGEFCVLAGANGSGKSTLLKLCVGLLVPNSGSVRLLGNSPAERRVLRRVGYAPQGLRAVTSLPVSVIEVVSAGLAANSRGGMRPDERVHSALAAVALEDLKEECLFELSGGQQQRAILARALVSDPRVLLLDEPATGIDQASRPLLAAELRRRADAGATILVVSHDPDDFHTVLDRILVITHGELRELAHEEFHQHFEVP
jgi:zinc transport system ATP-binding protein